jgi:hypothetical protein
MQLSLQTFQQLLQRMSAAVQSSASQLVDLSVGSMIRAILEANASIGLWVQWLIVQTLSMTRAATSAGEDLDTWMADFLLTRQPAVPAQGQAAFTRLLVTVPLLIPAGILVKTAATGVSFVVAADPTNLAWQVASNGYLLPPGVSSINLPSVAQSPGSGGNVTAGAISLIATAVPGLDNVSNTLALSGGSDAEGDAKFRARFQDYINSRSQATAVAVGYAVASMGQQFRYKKFENIDTAGGWLPGHFLVIVDDGSGQPTALTLSGVYAAIDNIRPIGSTFTVRAPDVVTINVAVALTPGGEPLNNAVQTLVINALSQYIGQVPIGGTLSMTRIAEVAYRAGRFDGNIASILINGNSRDVTCSPFGILKATSISVQ